MHQPLHQEASISAFGLCNRPEDRSAFPEWLLFRRHPRSTSSVSLWTPTFAHGEHVDQFRKSVSSILDMCVCVMTGDDWENGCLESLSLESGGQESLFLRSLQVVICHREYTVLTTVFQKSKKTQKIPTSIVF